MINLDFKDVIRSKYKSTGQFSEGLAPVRNQDNLWGYIDKKGNEVISCQFKTADNFSGGYAVVSNEEDKCGYIDLTGKIVIPCQFNKAFDFNEGLAAVKDISGLYGYINLNGEYAINPSFIEAYDFSEGYAHVKKCNASGIQYFSFINHDGIELVQYMWAQRFINGYATVATDESTAYIIDSNFKTCAKLSLEGKCVYAERCGVHKYISKEERYGFLDRNFNILIPAIFTKASHFNNDAATVELDENTIGFVTKEKMILFYKNLQYQEIKEFSENLAPVKGINNLWGYIDKTGKEVIPCQYLAADSFSEGLAGVIDSDHIFHYINKRGTKKITIGSIYESYLDTGYETICIRANSEKELCEKKLAVLAKVKDQLLQNVMESVNSSTSDITSELYELSKSKSNKPKLK